MKKILLKILLCVLFCCSILFCLTACNNGQPSIKGTEIYSETLTVDNQAKTVYGKLPNGTESYEVSKNIRVAEGATYHLCSDILGQNAIVSKTAVLETGDNVYYLIVENKNEIETYTLTLRVKPLYKVSFNINTKSFVEKNDTTQGSSGNGIIGGEVSSSSGIGYVESQYVEEDSVAIVPEQPTRLGCEFTGWNFDFSQKIIKDTTIVATWKKNQEMENFEFESDGGFCDIYSIIDKDVTTLSFPSCITSFKTDALKGCTNVTQIEIDFEHIRNVPLFYCSSLNKIVIGKNVKKIEQEVFPSRDLDIVINEENTLFTMRNNCLIDVSNKVLIKGNNQSTIPNDGSVEVIGYRAFAHCNTLTSIIIPNSVTSIGASAFLGCSSLLIYCEAKSKLHDWDSSWNDSECPIIWDYKNNAIANDGYIYTDVNGIRYGIKNGQAEVVLQVGNVVAANILSTIKYEDFIYNVTNIGENAFYGCSSLTSVTIPNSVTSIGDYAFEWCSSLTSVTIPNSVTSIGDWAFYGCRSLASVNYLGTIDSWVQIEFNSSYSNPLFYAKKLCTTEGLVTEASITTATKINDYAFYGYVSLTKITIGFNVTSIGDYAFRDCSGLESVVILKGVTNIGDYTFYGCDSLTRVEIPSDVIEIGRNAFANSMSLTIYCESVIKPSGWDSSWNSSYRPVVWNYKNA